MTAKEYLNRYIDLKDDIHIKQQEIKELEELASSVSPAMNFSGSGCISDKVGLNSAKIVDLVRETNEKLLLLLDMREDIKHKIEAIEDDTSRRLLMKRYLFGEKWEKIADELHYSYFHVVRRLHPHALDVFTKKYPEIEKEAT